MNIIMPAIGSRGDIQPFIALAQGLNRSGHKATLATHPVMKQLVEAHGIAFAQIGPDIDLAQEAARLRNQARNPALGLIRVMRFGFDLLEQSHDDIMALCRAADLVVVPAAVAAGKNEAELLGIPYLSVTLMPWAIPWTDPERPIHKRIGYGAIDRLVHLITTRPLNKLRKEYGLPPVGAEGLTSDTLNLVPVSPAVYPPNPLWEARHQMVGYWFAEEPPEWSPPADLIDFLNRGDPPLLITLGAMSLGEGDAAETVKIFLTAVQEAHVRAIIQGWEMVMDQIELPPTVCAWGSVPHSWLMPQCAAIIHHGGFGTTAAGLRAGKPALVIPHIADQFYWGQQVFELGAGPKPIPRTKLDPEDLTASIVSLLQDIEVQSNAASLGQQICTEAGVEKAIRLIDETFS